MEDLFRELNLDSQAIQRYSKICFEKGYTVKGFAILNTSHANVFPEFGVELAKLIIIKGYKKVLYYHNNFVYFNLKKFLN